VELDAVIGSADQQESPMRIAVGQVAPERGIPERAHYSLAFAANAQAMVFKFDGPDFYVYDLTNRRTSNRLGYLDIPPQHIVVTSDLPKEAWRLQPARIPWVYPPFAANSASIGELRGLRPMVFGRSKAATAIPAPLASFSGSTPR